MIKINYNSLIKVKLSDEGKRIYEQHYGEPPIIDDDGLTEFIFWKFMQIYGNKIHLCVLDDGCIYMNENDLKSET